MAFQVFLTESAAHDLEEIHDYVAQNDTPRKADALLTKIENLFKSLADSPDRGSRPKELTALGILEYRQVFLKPYRVIYRISSDRVCIMLIIDGRRDMQSLLERRLLESF